MTRCSICPKDADYLEKKEGPLCKGCWLGLKMFNFSPERLSRAKKYMLCGLNHRKQKKRKHKHVSYLPEDVKFNRMVREEIQAAPLKIPEVVASKPRKVRIVK
jgi:hypothetical protein